MTFEEFFERCWFWFYHNEEENVYAIEVGVDIDPYDYYIDCYEVTKELFSDKSSCKENIAKQFYDHLKEEKVI